MNVETVSPHNPQVQELIEKLNQHNLNFYPPEECHLDPPEVLSQDNCTMLGAFNNETLCGIGAIKLFEDYGEVKRMFVSPDYRGRGVAQLIVDELIKITLLAGKKYVRLETGEKFEAAFHFYKKNGFKVCAPFGQYKTEKHCTCMEKILDQ